MRRAFRSIAPLAALIILASCTSFSASPTVSPPETGDAGEKAPDEAGGPPLAPRDDGGNTPDTGPVACERPRFTDDFERGGLTGGGWDHTPPPQMGTGGNLSLQIGDDGGKDGKGLVVNASPRAAVTSAYLEKSLTPASCPITVAFDLYLEELNLAPNEYVTFMSIQLENEAAILLTLSQAKLTLFEQKGSTALSMGLADPPGDGWKRISLTYDPRPMNPLITVVIGSQPPIQYVTQLERAGSTQAVRFGAAYATLGADATLLLDNFSIE
ncbi:MAG: hypothetical protein K0S65_215 [Labilithrix sp.]|nr:hypothetical protein [Labilithrix sp.]